MKAIPRWLLIPPLVAALVVLGPLSMQSAASPAWSWPDLWQTTAALLVVALLGLVLLGAGGLVPRLRGQPKLGAKLVTLRQTQRLSAQLTVHALEFDDRILLVGEHARGLVLLESGRVPASGDEAPRQLTMPGLRPAAIPAGRTGHGLDDFRPWQRVGRA
ncbi:MAG TPA: hypothetical protein VFT55_06345 [Planctomycetota bacterium]|nr:hypothetical protein [Planctomycetota bacterium]